LNQPIHVHAPTVVEVLEKPVVVQETIIPTERTEVQPVIHRDIEQREVHKVLQPMREKDYAPTEIRSVQLQPEILQSQVPLEYTTVRGGPTVFSETVTTPVFREQLERAPIVEETIHKTVIEEVQPVLYKEVVRPTVVEATRPIYETVYQAPVVVEEVRPVVDLGTRVMQGQDIGLGQQTMLHQPFGQQTSSFAQNLSTAQNLAPGSEIIYEKTTTVINEPLRATNVTAGQQHGTGTFTPLTNPPH